MTKLIYISILLILVPVLGYNQTREKIDLNDGVANYERGRYQDAQTSFEKAYAENPNYARALYNAGNSAYLAGNFDTAMIYYNDYANKIKSNKEIAKAHFNIGNANLQKAAKAESSQETAKNAQAYYKEAINSYKQSLKHNPSDIEAKYNLTYALDKLQKNQQQQDQNGEGDQNKEDQDNSDKGEQNENGDKGDQQDKQDGEQGDKGEDGNNESDKGDKEEGDPKNDEEGDEKGDKQDNPDGKTEDGEKDGEDKEGQGNQGEKGEQSEEQPVEGQISKAQAIKDLDAINADEGKILQKVYQKKGDKKANNNSDKDW